MPGWEAGEITGTVTESTDDFIQVSQEGKQYPKKLWIGRQYEGTRPPVGTYAVVSFDTAPPQQGRKYGSSYLSAWQAATPPSNGAQNGSQRPSGASGGQSGQVFVGREPGTADKLQAARWAISTAVEALGPGKSDHGEYRAAGAFFYGAMLDIVEKHEPKEATKSEAQEDF